MLRDKQARLFRRFYESARDHEILDEKTTILVGLSAAMAAGCGP